MLSHQNATSQINTPCHHSKQLLPVRLRPATPKHRTSAAMGYAHFGMLQPTMSRTLVVDHDHVTTSTKQNNSLTFRNRKRFSWGTGDLRTERLRRLKSSFQRSSYEANKPSVPRVTHESHVWKRTLKKNIYLQVLFIDPSWFLSFLLDPSS